MKVFLTNWFTGALLDSFAGVSDMLVHFLADGSGDTIASSSKVKDTEGRNCGRRCSKATTLSAFSSASSASGAGLRDVISEETVLL